MFVTHKTTTTKYKKTKMYLNKTMAGKQERQKSMYLHILRTSVDKFWHYLQINVTSYY